MDSAIRPACSLLLSVLCLTGLISCFKGDEPLVVSPMDSSSKGPAVYQQACGHCHLPPDPGTHRAREWPLVVMRMQGHMSTQGKPPLTPENKLEIIGFLQAHAVDVL